MNKSAAQLLTATATGTTALLLSCSAQAALIDFETLRDGTTTPTDNAALTSSYTVDSTTVTFGFDTNGDLTIDADAVFESRNDGRTGLAYTHNLIPDIDRTTTNEGGDWLLRAPNELNLFDDFPGITPADFIVKYTGTPVRSASGQLWDLDAGEEYLIEALDSTGAVLSSIPTPEVPAGEGSDTFSGLPYNFSFNNVANDIGYIRISGISRIDGGGFAFDNFNATQSTVDPEPVPEPLTILGSVTALGFGGLLKRQHSRKQKKS